MGKRKVFKIRMCGNTLTKFSVSYEYCEHKDQTNFRYTDILAAYQQKHVSTALFTDNISD